MLSKTVRLENIELNSNDPISTWRPDLGAEKLDNGVHFRVWAPKCQTVELVLESKGTVIVMEKEEDGYYSTLVPDLPAGTLYRYRIDGKDKYPDPCSRFQPEGPHGPSMVVDPNDFTWTDAGWPGVEMKGQVIYEIHIGAFAWEGTFDAAILELEELRRIGVTLLEVMPVAEWSGHWNWGYDGVNLYAPSHNYGDYNAFKRFVDAAHAVGLAVILDVVYNHLGPDGNYTHVFSDYYYTDKYKNDWGQAINFDGYMSRPVREYAIQNACYWISQFHLDGLRLDATQDIHDSSDLHVLSELSQRTRQVAGNRKIILIGENESQDIRGLAPVTAHGYGLDAMWNDDYHHTSRVAATGFTEAYFTDYRGQPQEFISAYKYGFLFQGQYYVWQDQPRGSVVTDEPAWSFVHYIQNHDQIANSITGERIHQLTSPGKYRVLTTLLLLGPETPMLFMGQEFAASSPFLFFVDHQDWLKDGIRNGRREFLAQFPTYALPENQEKVPDPFGLETLNRCKLDFTERIKHAEVYKLHQDLLALRRNDPVLSQQNRRRIDGSVLGPDVFIIRFFGEIGGDDRLLAINLGAEFNYEPFPVPLLAPPQGRRWKMIWNSEDLDYGGKGFKKPIGIQMWKFPKESALLLAAVID